MHAVILNEGISVEHQTNMRYEHVIYCSQESVGWMIPELSGAE